MPVAHGSDGGGSIRIPAACCGVFGLKPSRGRVPMGPKRGEGWAGMSTDGVLSRSVRDTAAALDMISAYEAGAPYARLCHRIIVMQRGKVVESGSAQDVFLRPGSDYTRQLVASIPEQAAQAGKDMPQPRFA